jgi:hypothetical protein
LCYNFSRVLRILGFDRWMALMARRAAALAASLRTLCATVFVICRRISWGAESRRALGEPIEVAWLGLDFYR